MKRKKKNNMTKEIIILLLLVIIILLVMIVALYDFRSNNYLIPELVTYSSDAKTSLIKQEINYTNGGDATADGNLDNLMDSLQSYSIDATDLTVYSQKNKYISGNSNPFGYVEEEEEKEETSAVGGNSNQANQPNSTNTQSNSNNSQTNNTAVQPTNNATQPGSTTVQPTNVTPNQNNGGQTAGTFFEKPNSK